MIRSPPRSTRTDTRFPYTTLFRSESIVRLQQTIRKSKLPKTRSVLRRSDGLTKPEPVDGSRDCSSLPGGGGQEVGYRRQAANDISSRCQISVSAFGRSRIRSEERRVGKEWFSPCRSRWSPYQ